MSTELKNHAKGMVAKPGSIYAFIQSMIIEGFFDAPVSSSSVVIRIAEKFGKRVKSNHIQTYMRKFMLLGVIHAVKDQVSSTQYWVLASVSKYDALVTLKKSTQIQKLEERLFSDQLQQKLKRDFAVELEELHDNFGRNGNCTAFLLRKILEKLLIIVFGKLDRSSLVEDANRPGGWKGLKDLLDVATRERVAGIPLLTGKTANEIRGIKFLGDTAAHNPLISVNVGTIIPQMPFLITAYEELAARL
jgi:hypothetical protein